MHSGDDGATRQLTERYIAFLRSELTASMLELYGAADLRYFVLPDPLLQSALDRQPPSRRAAVVLEAIGAAEVSYPAGDQVADKREPAHQH